MKRFKKKKTNKSWMSIFLFFFKEKNYMFFFPFMGVSRHPCTNEDPPVIPKENMMQIS